MSGSPRQKRARTVVDSVAQVCRCNNCGETIPMPLGDVGWFSAVLKAFDRTHKHCAPDGIRRTVLATSRELRTERIPGDILTLLEDCRKQATTERTHFYTAAVIEKAIVEIKQLRARRL